VSYFFVMFIATEMTFSSSFFDDIKTLVTVVGLFASITFFFHADHTR